MTDSNLTPQTIVAYLATWPPYDEAVTMFNLIGEYLDAITERRDAWQQVIPVNPDGSKWGNDHRLNNFHTVADFLYRQGFVIGMPKFWDDVDEPEACAWALSKCNGQLATLHFNPFFKTRQFWVSGMPHPRNEQDDRIALPECLSWI